uniref:Uncharacterized protein n=1 Tax=Oryzias latipes TaxID=8090 RepID=A0A3P9I507_ORYLA
MASTIKLMSEEQLLCSICRDLFKEPVSTRCGHNYCKSCITQYWDSSCQIQCPLCRTKFHTRPKFLVNTEFRAMVEHFRHMKVNSEGEIAQAGDVPSHKTVCKTHDKMLELFCCTDQECVCLMCWRDDHTNHHVILFEKAFREKKALLTNAISEMKTTENKNAGSVNKQKTSFQQRKKASEKDMADIGMFLTGLVTEVQEGKGKVIELIKQKQKRVDTIGNVYFAKMDQEAAEMRRKRCELEQLLYQRYNQTAAIQSNSIEPLDNKQPVYGEMVKKSTAQMKKTLSNHIEGLLHQLSSEGCEGGLSLRHDRFVLSTLFGERFENLPIAFSTNSFSSGRFYYEVRVNKSQNFILGVAKESVNMKTVSYPTTVDGVWTIRLLFGNVYEVFDPNEIRLFLKQAAEVIGVFVDYEKGDVSFYDVEARYLMYSYKGCCFTERASSFKALLYAMTVAKPSTFCTINLYSWF